MNHYHEYDDECCVFDEAPFYSEHLHLDICEDFFVCNFLNRALHPCV